MSSTLPHPNPNLCQTRPSQPRSHSLLDPPPQPLSNRRRRIPRADRALVLDGRRQVCSPQQALASHPRVYALLEDGHDVRQWVPPRRWDGPAVPLMRKSAAATQESPVAEPIPEDEVLKLVGGLSTSFETVPTRVGDRVTTRRREHRRAGARRTSVVTSDDAIRPRPRKPTPHDVRARHPEHSNRARSC